MELTIDGLLIRDTFPRQIDLKVWYVDLIGKFTRPTTNNRSRDQG